MITVLISIICILISGCATVILDNEDTLKTPQPDSLRFDNPICVKLDFKTDNIGFFNEAEGIKEMSDLQMAKVSTGLSYYNIIQNCKDPIAKFTILFSSKTRNWWARSIWASLSFFTLGVIPFYVTAVGTISIVENGNVVAQADYEEKRLTSILAIPKWVYDNHRSVGQYQADIQKATVARREAFLIKAAISNRLPNGKNH